MPVAADQLTQYLHEANSKLCVWLDDLGLSPSPEAGQYTGSMSAATSPQMAGMLAELMRAGQCLRELPSEKDPTLEMEVNQYRKNVERLRDLLPSIHATLLRERARIEQERARVESAAEWVRRSRQTL